jgi:hypothetical protein
VAGQKCAKPAVSAVELGWRLDRLIRVTDFDWRGDSDALFIISPARYSGCLLGIFKKMRITNRPLRSNLV